MSEHFSLTEFQRSDLAKRNDIDNTIPANLIPAALRTLEMLERIRTHLSALAGHPVPIILSSGYRCPALNARVGSGPGSDHLKAAAVDWTAPSFGSPRLIALALQLKLMDLGVGQLIYEFSDWVHTSTLLPQKSINQILTINHAGTFPGIRES